MALLLYEKYLGERQSYQQRSNTGSAGQSRSSSRAASRGILTCLRQLWFVKMPHFPKHPTSFIMFSKSITFPGHSPCSQVNFCWSQEELSLKCLERDNGSRAPNPAFSWPPEEPQAPTMRASSQDLFYFLPSRPLCMPEISSLYALVSSHHSCKKLNCIVFFSRLMFLCNGRRGSWIIYVLLGTGIFVCMYFLGFSSHCIYRKVAAQTHYTMHIMSCQVQINMPRSTLIQVITWHWQRDIDPIKLRWSSLASVPLEQHSYTVQHCNLCRPDLACRMSLQLHSLGSTAHQRGLFRVGGWLWSQELTHNEARALPWLLAQIL